MSLADQIINHGPYGAYQIVPNAVMRYIESGQLNELRDELIAARALKELLARFQVEVDRWTDPIEVDMDHGDRCDWIISFTGEFNLAELVQRAAEHAEVCR